MKIITRLSVLIIFVVLEGFNLKIFNNNSAPNNCTKILPQDEFLLREKWYSNAWEIFNLKVVYLFNEINVD